ncbi:MAG: NRDE family protein [Myxococcota bacterium]
MCTLAVCLKTRPEFPLIVAANRDEALSRPARPPLLWTPDDAPPFVAGRDERGGGSWMGINAAGVFVGLTNLWWTDFTRPRPRSRGQLVVDLLAAKDLDDAQQLLASQPVEEMGPFNVVCATTTGEGFVAASADDLKITRLPPGVHVISNVLPMQPWAKTARVAKALQAAIEAPQGRLPNALACTLTPHTAGGSPSESVCVHTDRDYGTVSSAILLSPMEPRAGVLRYADRAPCLAPYVDCSALLSQL